MTKEQKIERLQKMSYRDYLLNVAKVHPDVPSLLGGVWCLGTDTASAWFAFYRYKPGIRRSRDRAAARFAREPRAHR